MANKKKEKPKVKVESVSSEDLEVDTNTSEKFVNDLVDTFKEKGALLEAQRIDEASNTADEIDLILNNEEPSIDYKTSQRVNHLLK